MNGGHVEEIKSRLPIEDVIGGYMTLEHKGKYLCARCPFHNEKSGSFYVSPDRGTYYCFGCGEKGDIFSFVEKYEGLDFRGALQLLANRAGVVLSPVSKETQTKNDVMYSCLESATVFFEKNLENNQNAKDYLTKRSITKETIKEFRIGFTLNKWDSLVNYLKLNGFSDETIIACGLGIKNENKDLNATIYDRFRARIMFPISDSSGRVIAYSARILPEFDDGKSGKYINSPETDLYHKSNILYGFHQAKQHIRKHDYSILVEGQFDVVLSHQFGFKNTLAVSGTSFGSDLESTSGTPTHFGLLSKLSKNMILALDSDDAGQKAQIKIINVVTPLGISLKMIKNLDDAKDPADILSSPDGVSLWKDILKNALNPIQALSISIIKKFEKRESQINEMKNVLLPIIAILPSSVDKYESAKIIEKYFSLPIDLILKDIESLGIKKPDASSVNSLENQNPNKTNNLVKENFWGIYFASLTLDSNLSKYRDSILKWFNENIPEEVRLNDENEFKDNKQVLAMKLDIEFSYSNKPDSFIEDIKLQYQEFIFRAILNKLKEEILHNGNDPGLIKKQWETQKLIEDIKEKRRLI
jgi:DNA primase